MWNSFLVKCINFVEIKYKNDEANHKVDLTTRIFPNGEKL